MVKDKALYHKKLANYFASKPLLNKGNLQNKSHVRKCVEQPWQQTNAKMWDETLDTLTSVDFIEAKCQGDLSFDLVNDFNLVMDFIPQNKYFRKSGIYTKNKIKEYVQDLINYAKGNINSINTISYTDPTAANLTNLNDDFDSFSGFKDLHQFIRTEVYTLSLFNKVDGFVNQHIINSIPKQKFKGSTEKCIIQKIIDKDYENDQPLKRIESDSALTHISICHLNDNIISLSRNLISIYNLNSLVSTSTINDSTAYDHYRTIKGWFCMDVSANGEILVAGRGRVEILRMDSIQLKEENKSLQDFCLEIWDLNSKICTDILIGHTDNINCVSITPDGRYAVSGSSDKTIRYWDLENKKCLKILEIHKGTVTAICISPNGCYAISGSKDSSLIYWNLIKNTFQYLDGHSGSISSVRLTPDNLFAISAEKNVEKILDNLGNLEEFDKKKTENVFIWDLSNFSILTKLNGDRYWINCVDITPDASLAASVGYEGLIRIWDIKSSYCITTLKTDHSNINNLIFSPDGSQLFSCSGRNNEPQSDENITSQTNEILVWHIKQKLTTNREKNLNILANKPLSSSLNKEIISLDGTLYQIDLLSGILIELSSLLPNNVSFRISYDKSYILFYKYNHVGLWDTKDNRVFKEYRSIGKIENAIILRDNRSIIYSETGNNDFNISSYEIGLIKRLDMETGEIYDIIAGFRNGDIIFKDFFGSRKIIYCDSSFSESKYNCNNSLRVFDFGTKESKELFAPNEIRHHFSITDIAISPSEEIVATCASRSGIYGEGDNFILIWDLKTYKVIKKFEGHKDVVNHIQFTPDGEYLMSCGDDNRIIKWNLNKSKIENTYDGHSKSIKSFELTDDSINMISISHDKTVRLWDLTTLKCSAVHPLRRELVSYYFIKDKDSIIVNELGNTYVLKFNYLNSGIKHCYPFKIWDTGMDNREFPSNEIYTSCPYCKQIFGNIKNSEKEILCPLCQNKSIAIFPWYLFKDEKDYSENSIMGYQNHNKNSFESNTPISLLNKATDFYTNNNYSNAIKYFEQFLIAIGRNSVEKYPIYNADYKHDNIILLKLACNLSIAEVEYNIAASLIKSHRGSYGGFGVTVNKIRARLEFNKEVDKSNALEEMIKSYRKY